MQRHELALKQINQVTFHEERKKLHCCNESVSSHNMFWSNFFFYNLLSCRWFYQTFALAKGETP